MEEAEQSEHQVRPIAILMIALLSIGGLLFLGWQAKLQSSPTGAIASDPYVVCCNTQEWRAASGGYSRGASVTKSVVCDPSELKEACCLRDGAARSRFPVRLVGSKEGYCSKDLPMKEYPASVPRGESFNVCCSVQAWGQAATGFYQGLAQTFTGYCDMYESANQCCLRSGQEYTGSSSVRLIGSRIGGCNKSTPQLSYPVWVR